MTSPELIIATAKDGILFSIRVFSRLVVNSSNVSFSEENTLEEIYYSEKAEEFRQKLSVEMGHYPDPCKNCQKHRSGTFTDAPNGFKYYGS